MFYSQRHQERVQQMASKPMSLTVLAAILVSLVICTGLVGHLDYQTQRLERASATCEYLTTTTLPSFNQCIQNQLEANNDH